MYQASDNTNNKVRDIVVDHQVRSSGPHLTDMFVIGMRWQLLKPLSSEKSGRLVEYLLGTYKIYIYKSLVSRRSRRGRRDQLVAS